jgi:c-di-GMP-binding flagellar brake protein YcgR
MSWKERVRGWLVGIGNRASWRTPNRRKFPRFQAEIPLVVSIVQDDEISSVRARADGISLGGLSAAGLEGLVVGQGVSLEMHLPNARQPMWLEGVVRHISGYYGVQFVTLSEGQEKLIKRYYRLQPREKRRSA